MNFAVVYENGMNQYNFTGNYSKNFRIENTTTIAAVNVEFGKSDFDYLKVVKANGNEMFIPKSRVISVELIK